MERAGSDLTAFGETVVFLDYFKDLPDPRQAGKVIYPLPEVLLLCLLAVLAGAETFVDIARFGEKKIALLRRFRPFCHGTPAHDHLGDILSVLDAEQFQRCFVDWVAALTGAPKEVIAIDGKTLRRSGGKKGAQAAVHMVSAFAAHQRLVLGQVKVADKSNEIVAIPKLLDLLAIEGAIVTIDAIGCQRDIAEKILTMKADYVLALKGSRQLQGRQGHPAADRRRRSRPHRDQDHHRDPRRRLAPAAPPMAGAAGRRHGREHARDRQQDRTRDPLLHHLARLARRPTRPRHPQPLGDRRVQGRARCHVGESPTGAKRTQAPKQGRRCGAKARRRSPPTTYSKGVCAKHQVATCSERRRSLVTWFNRWPRRSITREGSKGRRKESEAAVLTGGVSAAT